MMYENKIINILKSKIDRIMKFGTDVKWTLRNISTKFQSPTSSSFKVMKGNAKKKK